MCYVAAAQSAFASGASIGQDTSQRSGTSGTNPQAYPQQQGAAAGAAAAVGVAGAARQQQWHQQQQQQQQPLEDSAAQQGLVLRGAGQQQQQVIMQQQRQQYQQQYQQQEDGSDYERLQASNWVIDWSQLNTDLNNRRKIIGQGSYGRVTIGCYNQTGAWWCV
jgi:hypothetical protein